MEKKYKYEQGQRVYFNLDGNIKGWATICGAATDEIPPIGRNWIVKIHEPVPFDKEVYPFTHMAVFGSCLDTKEFELPKREDPPEGEGTPET